MNCSVILSAARSAVIPRGGAFAALEVHELAAPVVQHCLQKAGITPQQVDELIAGNALGAGGNPARVIALAAGLPLTVAGLTIDRQCCGGMDAILLADALIKSGQAEVVVAGGVESYSRRPDRLRTFADGRRPEPYDRPSFSPWADRDPEMATAADLLGSELGISQARQDDWAVQSHAKALAATIRMQSEIVPLNGQVRDAFARKLTARTCARATQIAGNVTQANTSVAADAAAFCVVVSRAFASANGLNGLEVVSGATLGGAPERPGIAPVAAIGTALEHAGLQPSDLSVAEIMEAFAVQAIACVEGAGLSAEITNLGGGSLARGHPIGASGAINVVRLFHELQLRKGYGLASIAAAGGLGTALILRS